MYRESILGEVLHSSRKPRRSIFLESGLNSGGTKVAPAFVNKPSEAFSLNENRAVIGTLKPIYFLMRLVGIFPVSSAPDGSFKFSLQWLAYSSAIFVIIIGLIGYVEWESVEIIRSQEGRFEEAVIDYLFTVYLLPIIINPIIWYEGRKLASVVTDWVLFEKIYNRVTRKKLALFLGNKPLIITGLLPMIACANMIVTHLTMAHIKIIQVVPYCYINALIYIVGGFWFIQCDIIGKVATTISEDFKTTLKHIGPVSHIADYRSLWMLLSKLIRDTGNASGYTVTFICLYLFLVITLTIYGLLSQIQTGFNEKDIGLAVNALFAIAVLFFLCDNAHYASNCVKVQFQKELLLVELTWMSDDAQQEINIFLRATEMSPTDISLAGFFDVNRNLFKSLLATMVTYLVVLLQFQISIPEDPGNAPGNISVLVTTPVPV